MRLIKIIDKWFFKQPAFREFVTKVLYGAKDTDVRIFGETLRVNTLRENGYYRSALFARNAAVFRDEAGVLMNLAKFVKPDGHFIDAGANIGLFFSLFSRFARMHPEFGVTAFEVHPSTFAMLKVNADRHGFQAMPVALGERERVGWNLSKVRYHTSQLWPQRQTPTPREKAFFQPIAARWTRLNGCPRTSF